MRSKDKNFEFWIEVQFYNYTYITLLIKELYFNLVDE